LIHSNFQTNRAKFDLLTAERTFVILCTCKMETTLLRTDESFRSKKDEDYHKGNSPLFLLPINSINTVVLDHTDIA
jgi:hypothetical protein